MAGGRDHELTTGKGSDDGKDARTSSGHDVQTVLSVLAEPNRKRIVDLLRNGPLGVGEIAERLGLRQPQTSKHLKVLSDNRLVEVSTRGNRRIYSLRSEPFVTLGNWLQSFEQVMRQRFDNLDDYLKELQRDREPQNRSTEEERNHE